MIDSNSHENVEFQNSEQKSLENLKLLVKDGPLTKTISTLDKYWVEKRCFLNYEAPNLIDSDGKYIIGAKERWVELVNFILDDLFWLLKLPSYKFWSNIIYNSAIINSLIIFLQEAPTPYTLKNFPDDYDLKELFDKIRQNILIIFVRLVKNKKNSYEYISLHKHAGLLYNEFIFSIPSLMDLCQQYGRDNKKIIEKIVNTVFTLQPRYKKDLDKAVLFIIQALRDIERRFEDCPISQEGKAVPLSERGGANKKITLSDLEDKILYLIDIISTLSIFIDVYFDAAIVFKKEHFLIKIVSVYSNTIPEMYKRLDTLAFKDEVIEKYLELKHLLDVTRLEFLNTYRKIIYSSIQQIHENKEVVSSSEIENIIEEFLTHLMLTLSEKEFVIDYYNLYPVMNDFQVILKHYPDVDPVKFEFINNSIFALFDEPVQIKSKIEDLVFITSQKSVPSNQSLEMKNNINLAGPSNSNIKSETDIISLISEVKDVLCDLGEEFIKKCLKFYNYKTDSVINAILEDSLPTELKSLDPTLSIISLDVEEASTSVDSAMGVQRLNIYDNDEFDVTTQDSIDKTKIHQGKRKDKYENLNELLNDKSHLIKTKDIYNKYNLVSNEYDDEYDDTYDNRDVGSNAQDDILEVDVRPFTVPRVLRKQEFNGLEVAEENASEDVTNSSTNLDHFVQDPALLRAKNEERRLSKQRVRMFCSQNKFVVGNPKGEAQSNEVINSRNKKNKQKSTRANHNRRTGSQWKRNQRMVPS